MAAGEFMLGNMAVVVSPNVPQFHSGTEIIPVPYSWLDVWLYRFFTGRELRPYRYARGREIMEEQAFQAANKLFVSPKMWEQIKAQTRQHAATANKKPRAA